MSEMTREALVIGRSYVQVAGTEFWIRVSRAEVREMEKATGLHVVPDVVDGDTYWTVDRGEA